MLQIRNNLQGNSYNVNPNCTDHMHRVQEGPGNFRPGRNKLVLPSGEFSFGVPISRTAQTMPREWKLAQTKNKIPHYRCSQDQCDRKSFAQGSSLNKNFSNTETQDQHYGYNGGTPQRQDPCRQLCVSLNNTIRAPEFLKINTREDGMEEIQKYEGFVGRVQKLLKPGQICPSLH